MTEASQDRPRPALRDLLTEIAEAGGIQGFVSTSSSEVGDRVDVSQQTASRWLVQLDEAGYLERRLGSSGQQLRLTDEGVSVLAAELDRLRAIFGEADTVHLTGTVAQGDGEGAYYMSQPFYKRGFEELVGFTPFPGTLNLELDGSDLDSMRALRNREALEIPQVKTPERTFGGVTAYPAEVGDQPAAVIFPHRTRHERVLEVIAPERLRDVLDLADGDELTVRVETRPDRRTHNPREDHEETG
jgi:riboflavin kinase